MSLITPSTHCKYSTMHLKSFQRFNISSFKGTRYYIKAPVNNYFTRAFLFFHDLANLSLRTINPNRADDRPELNGESSGIEQTILPYRAGGTFVFS